MILPIEASMHTPRHFDLVLSGTMAAVTSLYVAFGAVWAPPSLLHTHGQCIACGTGTSN